MAIGAVTSTANLQNNTLNLEDFLRVLTTQLTYQDPLKPLDNQEFMAQLAQFTSLEQTQQLNSKIETLINNQAALQSVGLIGRTVDITTTGGSFSGTVRTLSFTGDSPVISILTTGGATIDSISLSQIISVR
jgi:flagellar basal-body rod modification protein FlgD